MCCDPPSKTLLGQRQFFIHLASIDNINSHIISKFQPNKNLAYYCFPGFCESQITMHFNGSCYISPTFHPLFKTNYIENYTFSNQILWQFYFCLNKEQHILRQSKLKNVGQDFEKNVMKSDGIGHEKILSVGDNFLPSFEFD